MPWNLVFPAGTDIVSQAPPLFQQNWAFLQTNIGTDHFFNDTVTPVNEGHHKYVQMPDTGIPALAAGMSAVLFTDGMGGAGSQQPFWRNALNTRQIPTLRVGTTAVVVGVNTLINLAGEPGTSGILEMFQAGGTANKGVAYVVWDGASTSVLQLGVSGGITAITQNTTLVRVTSTFIGNIQWALYTLPN